MAVYYHEGKFPPANLDWRRLAEPIERATNALARYDSFAMLMKKETARHGRTAPDLSSYPGGRTQGFVSKERNLLSRTLAPDIGLRGRPRPEL